MSKYLSENVNEIIFSKRFSIDKQDVALFYNMYRDYTAELGLYSTRIKAKQVTDKELDNILANMLLMKMFILNDDGEKIGFCLVGFGQNTHPLTSYYIAEFYVLPKYRRMGFGEKAVYDLLSILPGTYCYHVLKSNVNARTFWDNILKKFGCKRLHIDDTLELEDCDFYSFKSSMKA